MPQQINVISADLDGAELRREKHKNPYHVRCVGKADDQDINDALRSVGKGMRISIPAEAWERIFGASGTDGSLT